MEASGDLYSQRQSFVDRVYCEAEITLKERTPHLKPRPQVQARESRSIEFFCAKPVYAADKTRADLAYAVYALAHGTSEADIGDAIRSGDLRHKGTEKRQAEYVQQTVKKAYAALNCRGR